MKSLEYWRNEAWFTAPSVAQKMRKRQVFVLNVGNLCMCRLEGSGVQMIVLDLKRTRKTMNVSAFHMAVQ